MLQGPSGAKRGGLAPGTAAAARQSSRLEASDAIRVLDEATRNRRLRRQLASLEQDNAHDDPHAQLQWHKHRPKFEDHEVEVTLEGSKPKKRKVEDQSAVAKIKKKLRNEHSKQRFRKNFTMLLEEENASNKDWPQAHGAYMKAAAPLSKLPPKKMCAVCGFPSKYNCVRCGGRYCSLPCRDVHNDTRFDPIAEVFEMDSVKKLNDV